MSGAGMSCSAPRRRVRLTTEGNYPDVVGGVTRWCDLVLAGLDEIDWEVFALGVTPTGTTRHGITIRYPNTDLPVGTTPDHHDVDRVIDALGRSLFAESSDPDALMYSLIQLRRLGPVPTGVVERLVNEMLFSWAPVSLRGDRPAPVPRAAVDEAVGAVVAVIGAAVTPVSMVDVNLSATVGVAAVPGVIDRSQFGTPLIAVEHGIYVREAFARTEDPETGGWVQWVVRSSATNLASLTYAMASLVVGVSEANVKASTSLGADPSRTVCIPNGVSAPEKCPPVLGRSRVGSVGRVDPLKGVDLFVSTAALVAERLPGATFTHIGPVEPLQTEYRRQCGRLAEHPALRGRMTFMGLHPDPPAILPAIDVQVIPSRSEGLPFSLLEGMAAGRPIVATAVGGISEVLGGVGLVVEPGDLDALADGVEELCRDLPLARRLGGLAHEVVRELYPMDRMLDGFRDALESVSRTEVLR